MITKNDVDYVADWELMAKHQVHPARRTAVVTLEVVLRLKQELQRRYTHLIIEKPQTEYEFGRSEMARHIVKDLEDVFGVEGEK